MNFEHVGPGLFTLFLMSTLDGTIDFFIVAKNSGTESQGPILNNNLISSTIFFLLFIFFGTLFLIDLFTAVLYFNYKLLHTSLSEGKFYSSLQLTWIELQRKILRHNYSRTNIFLSYSTIRKKFYIFFKSEIYVFIKSLLILSNIVFFCMEYQGQNPSYQQYIFYLDSSITIFLFLELAFKIFTLGKKNFLSQFYNIWETICFILSSIGIILYFNGVISYNNYKFLTLSKLIRILYIIKKLNGATKILVTLQFIMPGLIPFFVLISMLIVFFGGLGNFLFFDIDINVQGFWNFKDYFHSYLLLLKISSLDSIWSVLERYIEKSKVASFFYFTFFIVFSEYIFYNLFSMAFIHQFEDYYLKSKNPMLRNKADLESFDNTWEAFTINNENDEISADNILMFLRKLRYPLGLRLNHDLDFYFEAYKMKILM